MRLPPPSREGVTLEFDGVTILYGDVLGASGVSVRFEPGVTGMLGPNGSGKSTLLHAAAGLLAPREGRVTVGGRDPLRSGAARRNVALVPAVDCFHASLDGVRNLVWAFRARGFSRAEARRRAYEALEAVGLSADAHRRVGRWSRGMRQRLKLAAVLWSGAPVWLLDEPLSGVDLSHRLRVREAIRQAGQRGYTVVFASHLLHEVEATTDRVAVVVAGRLITVGTVAQAFRHLRQLEPTEVTLHASDPHALAGRLAALSFVDGIWFGEGAGILHVRARDPAALAAALPSAVVDSGVRVTRVSPRGEILDVLLGEAVRAARNL